MISINYYINDNINRNCDSVQKSVYKSQNVKLKILYINHLTCYIYNLKTLIKHTYQNV